ncbi:Na/Pi cotransporter family protein [Parablautia intestinalis]|uniref:Na/Pi cotransporter family protein n=1 Tax=Parablautia intestinalis TaxID=2320100 RepID=A0A3A9AVZ3_9FIRM|nr:Na/Pi cotransporter family protein [Parablautia intestinalis]RKI91713.1 Na/Pi cotransporter family protein [Parablautia intestinalis]
MDIFSVLTMVGGLALFLYGMDVLGDGLKKASGGKLEIILEKLTANKLMAILLGAGVTAIIQSSSATTVMVVGFVNSGIMKLGQAIGVILGANVGTTVTAWLLSLTGVEGSGIFFEFLKPSSFSPILAITGVIMMSMCKREKHKVAATIMVGFAVLMFGMDTMSSTVKPLAENPDFIDILLMFSNPVLGMLIGLVLTAIIQSSSASVGILQALCVSGAVSYSTAIPIIMGQNVGDCVAALLSSASAGRQAKRAALISLYYKVIKVVAFMVIFYALNAVFQFAFLNRPASALGVAAIHTMFNVVAVVAMYPFTWVLEKLAYLTIPESDDETKASAQGKKEIQILDARFLSTPRVAIEQCKNAAFDMASYAKDGLFLAMELFDKFDQKAADKVIELENLVDHYEDELSAYLVKISSKHLTEKDSQEVTILLHCIGDFERISDHAVNIMESAKEMYEKDLRFSKKAMEELAVFSKAVRNIINASVQVFRQEDLQLANTVEPLEEVIDYLNSEIKKRHVKRLRKGKCTIEMGFILSDISTNYERVSDHCSNIALCLLQLNEENFGTHEFQEHLSNKNNDRFVEEVKRLQEQYKLP